MLQPELSGQILDRKLDNVIATGAEQVVTGQSRLHVANRARSEAEGA